MPSRWWGVVGLDGGHYVIEWTSLPSDGTVIRTEFKPIAGPFDTPEEADWHRLVVVEPRAAAVEQLIQETGGR